MTNPTLALNALTRSTSSTGSPPSTSSKATDEGTSSSVPRFDAAMQAARAHAATSSSAHAPTHASTSTSAPAPASAASGKDKASAHEKTHDASDADDAAPAGSSAKAVKKADDETVKKDDDKDATDDTSIASSVLALIGVPPKVTELAGKVLKGATSLVTGKVGDAIGALVPGAGSTGEAVAGGKDALAAVTGTTGTGTTAAAASPFATLAAAQELVGAVKEDAPSKDVTGLSPMPYSHAQGAALVDAPAVQVQATQAATSPQFAQELGEQIAWMGGGDVKEARIKLHPEELGSMDVRVNLDGGKVNVAIIAQHPAAVHAVQQTLSQLDTLLAHHGLSLGQASVGHGNTGQGSGGNGGSQGESGRDAGSGDATVLATSRVSRGLVDEVA